MDKTCNNKNENEMKYINFKKIWRKTWTLVVTSSSCDFAESSCLRTILIKLLSIVAKSVEGGDMKPVCRVGNFWKNDPHFCEVPLLGIIGWIKKDPGIFIGVVLFGLGLTIGVEW